VFHAPSPYDLLAAFVGRAAKGTQQTKNDKPTVMKAFTNGAMFRHITILYISLDFCLLIS
jgi:hypothetical protein